MSLDRTVALVGRPNVGKSRLFNRLAGKRIAIVHDLAGVTRDVNSTVIKNDYTLLDTGGIGLVVDMDHQKLISAAEQQVWFAVESSTIICMVVDAKEGLTTYDETIAAKLRESGKEILLVVNKVDHSGIEEKLSEFEPLGFKKIIPVSAEHGYNEEEVHEAIEECLGPPPEDRVAKETKKRIKLAFVGRPNVGKSSLCNRLLENERLVVSEVPGTTRDSVELDLDYESADGQSWPFRLIDTAGLRRRKRVSHSVEYFSTVRSRQAIEEADVIFHVIDSESGVTRQDKALAGEIIEAGKCVCLLINKWDVAIDRFRANQPEGYDSIKEFRADYAEAALGEIFFLPDSPSIFVSAKTGLSIDRIFKVARQLWETSGRKISTPKLNKLVEQLVSKRQPKFTHNKQFKAYYTVQTGNRPFVFRMFCNRATKLDDSYRRYLQSSFIKEFKLSGCPVRFELRGKEVRYADKERIRPSMRPKIKAEERKKQKQNQKRKR